MAFALAARTSTAFPESGTDVERPAGHNDFDHDKISRVLSFPSSLGLKLISYTRVCVTSFHVLP